jgi:hypothetical protein
MASTAYILLEAVVARLHVLLRCGAPARQEGMDPLNDNHRAKPPSPDSHPSRPAILHGGEEGRTRGRQAGVTAADLSRRRSGGRQDLPPP